MTVDTQQSKFCPAIEIRVRFHGDLVRIEIAPSVVATLDRRAIAAVETEIEVETGPETEAPEPETSREPR